MFTFQTLRSLSANPDPEVCHVMITVSRACETQHVTGMVTADLRDYVTTALPIGIELFSAQSFGKMVSIESSFVFLRLLMFFETKGTKQYTNLGKGITSGL